MDTLPVLPSGRSLDHSLLLLIPLSVLVSALTVRYQAGDWDSAFAIGVLSHTLVDVLPPVVRGEFAYTTSLVWPLLPYHRTMSGDGRSSTISSRWN